MKNKHNSTERRSPSTDLPIDSVAQAFYLAKYLYGASGSPLVFTKSAEEAALQSPFLRPAEVVRYIEQLWVFATRLSKTRGALGTSFATYFSSVGLGGYRPAISQTAEGMYGSDYRVRHEGREFRCDYHFTLGAKSANTCLSIHFDIDPLTRRVLITHCGRHLNNTQS